MANTRSAQKRNRQSIKRRARNLSVRNNLKSTVRKAREAIVAGDPAKAKEALRLATKTLDRASSKGVIHAGNAARRIARLAHMLTAQAKKPAPAAAAAAKK